MHVTRGARHDAGGEPADDRRLGRLLQGRRAARCSTTPSTSSTATRHNPEYALQTLQAAERGRGERASSCATPTAARCPSEVAERGREPCGERLRVRGRHPLPQRLRRWPWPTRWPPCAQGATQVQGTINGIGERCGNVDLVSVIANLALKYGYDVLQPGQPAAADGGVALRLRDGEHELPPRPAVRRRQRLRPQGRHAHARASPRTRPATSTSTRRWSATSGASWSASCRGSRPS